MSEEIIVLDLLCGNRRIVGKEYNMLSRYNDALCETEFGFWKFKKLLWRYTRLDERYENTLNFITEENLRRFVFECRTFLKLPVEEEEKSSSGCVKKLRHNREKREKGKRKS